MVLFKQFITIPSTEYQVNSVSTISNPKNSSLVFIQKDYEGLLENLNNVKGCCVVAENGMSISDDLYKIHNFILTDNPRLHFAKIYSLLAEYDEKNSRNRNYSNVNGALIGENVIIGENTIIEPFCFIDHDVIIGSNTVIRSGTRIRRNTKIGSDCLIKENSVIGTPGFSFEKDEEDNFIKVPQLGGVVIHDKVELGALSTVDSGAIEPTLINDQVKMMDHAHVAHNVTIGEKTVVGAGTTIAGSTKIGKDVWISPNCTITHKISIGDGVVIGLSARIHKSVPAGTTMINEGAEVLERLLQFIDYKNELLGETEYTERKFGRGHPYYK
ncbi:UDP-3-O-(3-hydroxymyristoyl)glucosamine N-acyltransferase [Ornithinibacillus halophilus]|uniref:UDP-3-O-[3-hydroxymyristoyl] glucosamine N-acyltransferase n=1 Tax=Ornithinibacillus halophilus TaxID=930117 RepID=A0A1M5GHL1_9BACI|nr:UDP-3-O-(3-hydroxymyristoyl)glucosamine N-acyltransferase [Ornithinibacillus halophilus]SHG03203.1 UDP-3-O-[3-hydroxymyristoyl] glucosamine N-acyltransferase [Ornithinibacillus halophilus]